MIDSGRGCEPGTQAALWQIMMGGDLGKPWGKGEKKHSVMVFIGKKLPKDLFIAGLEQCLG